MARYREIMDDIKNFIVEEKLSFGDKLASERDMSQKYNVSSKTIKAALRELQYEGVIFRQNGKGTFVGKNVTKAGVLAFFIPNMAPFGYHFSIWEKTEFECLNKNIKMIYMPTHNSFEMTVGNINSLENMNLSGIVFTPLVGQDAKYNKDIINLLKKKTNNVVLLFTQVETKNPYSFVGNENVGSSFKLTEHLIHNRYKSYCFITNIESSVVKDRKKGFLDALGSYKIKKSNIINITMNPFDEVKVFNEIIKIIKKYKSIGIFVINDLIADRLIYKIRERNYEIPVDIGIVGFGGVSSSVQLPLTTAKIDFPKMARSIVDIIKSGKDKTIVVPTKIIKGKTT